MTKNTQKTYSAKPTEVVRKWHLIDASGKTLGRLSTAVSNLLVGKGKPMYTPHIDCGDYVIVINSAKVKVTGNKATQRVYYRHSGYAGALKERTLEEQMKKDPNQVIIKSVKGMLPKNKLLKGRLARLKVYSEDEHQQGGQKPERVEV